MNTPDKNKKDQQEKIFPGYPSYPASDDVTNQNEQIDYGHLRSKTKNPSEALDEHPEQKAGDIPPPRNSDDDFDPDSDVSPEEIAMLDASDRNKDLEQKDWEDNQLDKTDVDGDPLNEYPEGYEEKGVDLDVPGSESDDGNEAIGEEDEENNYYSLSDNQDNPVE